MLLNWCDKGESNMGQQRLALALVVALLLIGIGLVHAADPTAPQSLTSSGPSTFDSNNYDPQSTDAIAGNITALVITAVGQTRTWQGYHGNITGSITLDDANNFTFYNWSSAEPQGQIYATLNDSIAWSGVGCFNYSNVTAAHWTTIESYYGIGTDDVDGINETFAATNHPSFQVGSRTMTGCPTTYVFQNDEPQTANFVNVLLYDPTINDTGWIYTTVIENKTVGSTNDLICYNGAPCDFQILVNDDGHGTNTAVTTYYFWVELL
jgi:hypothetical protein